MYADVLSPSAVERFEKCPKQYWFASKNFQSKPRGYGGAVGSCFHQAIETYIDMHYKKSFEVALAWSVANQEYFSGEVQEETLKIWNAWIQKHTLPNIINVGNLTFPITELAFGPTGDKVHGIVIQPKNQVNFESGLRVHGFIDMIYAETNNENQITNLVVVDWKTQRYKIPFIHLKRQAQIYALAVQKLTGFPVRVEFAFIRFPQDSLVKWTPTKEELTKLEAELANLQNHISLLPDDKVAGRVGEHCKWCPFNFDCKEYSDWINRPNLQSKIWHTMTLEELAGEFDQIRSKKAVVTKQFYEIRDLMISEMQRKNIDMVGDFMIDNRWDKEYSEEAETVIRDAGGASYLPQKILDEIEMKHTTYSPGNPYIRKVKNASY